MRLKQQSIIDFKEAEDTKKKQKATPMMRQYLEVKDRHKEYLLFYRMGDFYELFFEDAVLAAEQLGITLTKRGKLNDKDIPMCGVPVHSVQGYLSRLIKFGHKIAIAEQLGIPENENDRNGKIFIRDVVRIITPGTIIEEPLLESNDHNFLSSIYIKKGCASVAWTDITTGTINVKSLSSRNIAIELDELLYKINPKEIIVDNQTTKNIEVKKQIERFSSKITIVPQESFDLKNNEEKIKFFFSIENIHAYGELSPTCISSSGSLIRYLELTQKKNIPKISKLKILNDDEFMEVDKISTESLEIFCRSNGEKKGSLFNTIDHTVSSNGSRLLRDFLQRPLKNEKLINERLDYVQILINKDNLINEIRDELKAIPDLERTISRISAKIKNPRDALIIANFIGKSLKTFSTIFSKNDSFLLKLCPNKKTIDKLINLEKFIRKKLLEPPPINCNEGGFIRDNVSAELDDLRNIKVSQKKNFINYQIKYSKLLGINNLKIKFNNFHGYFIEVSNKNSRVVRENKQTQFNLVQTTLNVSRFQTFELKQTSIKIEDAEIKAIALEKSIYDDITNEISLNYELLSKTSYSISLIDVLNSFAYVSKKDNFIRPSFVKNRELKIVGGRHPVVEQSLLKQGKNFISNDCVLHDQEQTWLMTGPNMAGKSTFLRQVAIITILSQIGCFVPAKSVSLKIVDKVFTRIGASDDLSQGMSTFMTEMSETARILSGATENSLIILDELGRGTSTNDGLSIAWAILEFIIKKIKCPTLFATHYKELTAIHKHFPRLKLKTLKTKEWEDDIIFMYKIIDGISESSFGLHVAKIAGIESQIVSRASEILTKIKKESNISHEINVRENYNDLKPSNSDSLKEILKAIKEIDPDELTAKEALEMIYYLKNKSKN